MLGLSHPMLGSHALLTGMERCGYKVHLWAVQMVIQGDFSHKQLVGVGLIALVTLSRASSIAKNTATPLLIPATVQSPEPREFSQQPGRPNAQRRGEL